MNIHIVRQRRYDIASKIDIEILSLINSLRGFKGTDEEFCLLNYHNVLNIIKLIEKIEIISYNNLTNCNLHLIVNMMIKYGFFKKELSKESILEYKKMKLSSFI